MAGRGRGRGRGSAPAAPSKPGGGAGKEPIDQLDMLVKSLSLDAEDKELLPVKETAVKAATSEDKLKEIYDTMYQRCQEDWRFSPCAARICCQLITAEYETAEIDGTKFRNTLIASVHVDIKNKDTLRKDSPQKLLGAISFLCQIFDQMRDEQGGVFAPLATSVIDSINMLMDNQATDEEMWCAAEQFYAIGKPLTQCIEKIKMTSLRNKVKDKIIHAVGSKEVRTELIKVVEGFASDWKQQSS